MVITSACRSRWRTCEETGAGSRPSFAQTASSTSGGRCEKVPTAPESLPWAIVSRGPVEPRELALQLRVPQRHLEAEGHGLGVDAVGAPDHRRVLVTEGALPDRLQEVDEVRADEVAGVAHQDGEGRVHHVRRGEAVVQPAPLGPDALGDAGDEGDDVVLDLPLDLLDAGDVEAGPRLDRGEGLAGTTPRSTSTSVAAISTSSHVAKRFSSDQRRAISGRE